jgi:hypothetical protein
MTRFAGYRLLGCPHCQAVHAVANLVSFNLMSFETWTDGQKVHALVDHREGVRQCASCDGVFLERETLFMGKARTRWRNDEEPYEIPAFLLRPANEPVWTMQRLREKLSSVFAWVMRGGLPAPASRHTDGGASAAVANDTYVEYPDFCYVPDIALAGLIAQGSQSDELMLALRTLYWRYLNTPYRDTARRLLEKNRDPTVAFMASDLQTSNMRELLALLNKYRPEAVVTRAEIHRELGEFTAAVELLSALDGSDEEANTILKAARQQVAAPVPVVYAWQRKTPMA